MDDIQAVAAHTSGILGTLAEGEGAPKLEETLEDLHLKGIHHVEDVMTTLANAFKQHKFPALSSLTLGEYVYLDSVSFAALMDGLQAHQGLRRLQILQTSLEQVDVDRLARAGGTGWGAGTSARAQAVGNGLL
jgi:hypothetical protein